MSILDELDSFQSELEIEVSDNPEEVQMRIRRLQTIMARSGKIWADAKRDLKAAMKAEITKTIIEIAQAQFLSAKAQNALVDCLCSNHAHLVDYSDRINKTATHQSDAMRSLLSYEKQLLNNLGS